VVSSHSRVDSEENDLKQIISQKRRHLHKLQEQQAAFGLHTPPYILLQIEDLESEIAALQADLETYASQKNGQSGWQALVIDTDYHWREIIATEINALGGAAIQTQLIPAIAEDEVIKNCVVAIVGAVESTASRSTTDWMQQLIQLGRQVPIILLTNWDNRDIAISVRHALHNQCSDATITTIFKENFDGYWFSQVIQHILLAH
jgi:hypothetical protein